ncbi:MAG: right-handed parallel beta-helix repeat-containing protein [Methanophagales archaeon]|nr:right-handed parallel beta-helix repeat-containing protein [Methanophagales archaeon]
MSDTGSCKILAILTALVLIGSCAAMPSAGDVSESEVKSSSSATIYVPDDYPMIQAAVNGAFTGDTIIVRDGIYIENIDVKKPHLTIKSENDSENCIVQVANLYDHVFEVTADYVNISGFTVKGAPLFKAGIYLGRAKHCNISFNNVSNNNNGIYLGSSSNNSITSNNVNRNEKGILLSSSNNNNIINNTISSNKDCGISLFSSNDNKIYVSSPN